MRKFLGILSTSFSLTTNPDWATVKDKAQQEVLFNTIFNIVFGFLGIIIFIFWLFYVVHSFFKS